MDNLEKRIEILRDKLIRMIESKELTDTKVVICSQELDKLLVQYVRENQLYIGR